MKPANIIVDKRGYVKLIDLGISKTTLHTFTQNTGLGTAHYAAPEQFIKGRRISTAIDIWAWSIIVNQMITRKVPYDTKDWWQAIVGLINKHKQWKIDMSIP